MRTSQIMKWKDVKYPKWKVVLAGVKKSLDKYT